VFTPDDSKYISIHSPRMGRDNLRPPGKLSDGIFQSTLPAWGETEVNPKNGLIKAKFQSTLPAWGET